MNDIKVGDLVDITIKGVRVADQYPNGSVIIEADTSGGGYGTWPMPPQAAVTRVAPAEWPPQPGDLWRTDDDEGLWVALLQVTKHTQEGALWLMQVYGGDEITSEDLLAKFGPDVLRLVYREEQGGGEQA